MELVDLVPMDQVWNSRTYLVKQVQTTRVRRRHTMTAAGGLEPSQMNTFGDRLKAARAEASLTQEALGLAVGVSKQAVSDWENGRQFPNPQAWPLLRENLPITLDELICGEELGRIRKVQEDAARYSAQLTPELTKILEMARKWSPERLRALMVLLDG
jgi:transcriptional regulator with XRE-family HTH domain